MAHALHATAASAQDVSFELDGFELTTADRLELTGRWFGIRGRRFVRPMLTLLVGTERCRSLADLEHKPWAAHDGDDWTAAFPLDVEAAEVLEVELSVAPDITIPLPAPPGPAGAPAKRTHPAPRGRVSAERRDLGQARREVLRLRSELEASNQAAAAASAELAGARRALDAADTEAIQWHATRQAADTAELQAASMRASRDAARGRVDAEIERRDELARERDQVLRAHAQTTAERDALARERDRLQGQITTLLGERDQLRRALELVQRESAGDAEGRPVQRQVAGERRRASWAVRALTIAVMLVVIVALLLVVRSG